MDGIIQVIRVDAVKADNNNISFKGAGLLEESVIKDIIANTLRQSKKLLADGLIIDIVSESNDTLIDGGYNITLHLKTTPDLKNTIYGYDMLDDNARITEHLVTVFGVNIKFERSDADILARIVE